MPDMVKQVAVLFDVYFTPRTVDVQELEEQLGETPSGDGALVQVIEVTADGPTFGPKVPARLWTGCTPVLQIAFLTGQALRGRGALGGEV